MSWFGKKSDVKTPEQVKQDRIDLEIFLRDFHAMVRGLAAGGIVTIEWAAARADLPAELRKKVFWLAEGLRSAKRSLTVADLDNDRLTPGEADLIRSAFRAIGVWDYSFPMTLVAKHPHTAYFAMQNLMNAAVHFDDAVPRLAGLWRYYVKAPMADTLAQGWFHIWAHLETKMMLGIDQSPRFAGSGTLDLFAANVFAANGIYTVVEYEFDPSEPQFEPEEPQDAPDPALLTRSTRFAVIRQSETGVFEGHVVGPSYAGRVLLIRIAEGNDVTLLASDETLPKPGLIDTKAIDARATYGTKDKYAAAYFGLPERKSDPAKS